LYTSNTQNACQQKIPKKLHHTHKMPVNKKEIPKKEKYIFIEIQV
jgi:hypothetical protein